MSEYNRFALNFENEWRNNSKYFEMLAMLASLSKIFSENEIPFLDYRIAENLFCKYFQAQNDARSCMAYDARIKNLGIGIKTFILSGSSHKEKIAEFNKLKPELTPLKGIELARKLGELRNRRIVLANEIYNVSGRCYHIVGRMAGGLRIFNSPYDMIDVDKIVLTKKCEKSIAFTDGKHEYSFNDSKSVLMQRFVVPENGFKDVDVEILEDPLALLEKIMKRDDRQILVPAHSFKKGYDYVVLPLYSVRTGIVSKKSGLNQWNAGGRSRDPDEVYIPIPKFIHNNWGEFFPNRDTPFVLNLPDGSSLNAKICQENGKALMSNPNKDLGKWLLRKVLKKKEGELVTMDDFNRLGVDSIIVINHHKTNEEGESVYSIQFSNNYESYELFKSETDLNM